MKTKTTAQTDGGFRVIRLYAYKDQFLLAWKHSLQ
jgi:hypothetical protein